ncbi:MAG: hemolysin III family protein [Anaeromyxobacter sp.]|nr:hemolysin III family protein [Anaeromyxobacter sp.]MBL0274897.1 hemolysin III family protein [Anaeromyxobacter sp.]
MATTGADARPQAAEATPRPKPRLRGVSHEVAAVASLPAVAALLLRARGGAALWGAGVYGASLLTLFTVSAVYHRRFWPLRARQIVGRIDHSAIFLLIAGTYTPFGLLLGPGAGHLALWVVWGGALVGIGLVVFWPGLTKRMRAGIYVLLGWVVVPLLPRLGDLLGPGALALLLAGGFFYTVGAVIYGVRRPDPFPRTFGFHEIFHLLVIAAAACHYLVVEAAVRALG